MFRIQRFSVKNSMDGESSSLLNIDYIFKQNFLSTGSNTDQTGVMIVQHTHYAKLGVSCRSRYTIYVSVYFKRLELKQYICFLLLICPGSNLAFINMMRYFTFLTCNIQLNSCMFY